MRCFARLLLLWLAAVAVPAFAHKASDSYLQLTATPTGTTLRVDVALRDLDVALDLDANADGQLTWGEVKQAWPGIERYLTERVRVDGCDFTSTDRALERRADGTYAALLLASPCVLTAPPVIRYMVMTEVDPTHRGIARIAIDDRPAIVRILTPVRYVPREAAPASTPAAVASPASIASTASQASIASTASQASASPPTVVETTPAAEAVETPSVLEFLREGMRHILTGYDHVLFLICLLLPSVVRRTNLPVADASVDPRSGSGPARQQPGARPAGWRPVERLRDAVLPILGIVTAFTLAHSITLGLAASGKVSLSPAFIEPAIAVTIMLAALDNLWPIFRGRRVVVTFFFGLIHGFGFAGVLAELNLPTAQFAWALLQFNVGLEMGQLVIVIVATSILFGLRRRPGYPAVVIRGGSVVAIVIAAIWFVERVANLSLMPF